MNALTVNGKQLFAACESKVELLYYPETLANNWAIFPGGGNMIYAGEYEFRVNVPDAAYVYGRNLPGMDPTPIPIVNGVAKWTNPENFVVFNTSIYFLCLLPEDYTTVYPDPDALDVTLTPSNFMLIKTDEPLEILGYEETTVGYSAFKLLMRGVGPHTSTYPSNYVEWTEVGMSWQDNVDRIGPSYFTVDSTAISGTPWGNGNPDKLFDGSTGGGGYDKFDAHNFTAAEVVFHTNYAIVPSAYSFWSCDNQWHNNAVDYAAPNTFTFYGKNETTQQYEELITVSASQLDMHNNAKTTILAE